ncbi:MAG: radical SAM protein [Cyanobacteria bacterium HKST-UBA04]|nr:radical SAM protein [Cyanobacteria bacterium HKST-UBA04]MCA9841617.1 radical SAM protein [Cyanobacteria bacterium HKST-UBA03]
MVKTQPPPSPPLSQLAEADASNPVLKGGFANKPTVSTVYGPVRSWRFGASLGIDVIRDTSTCSFNCIYCQLGDIQKKTNSRQLFVPTDTIMADLAPVNWNEVDVITLSGSGEPTLATNLGEVIAGLKARTQKPITVLTNGTLLNDPAVVADLQQADTVAIKLDAATQETLQQINRPVDGITLESIVAGAAAFRKQYPGKLCIQTMFMPANRAELEGLADLIKAIHPDEVQLNTPKRPYPLAWHVESRGNHTPNPTYETRPLRTIDPDEATRIETTLTQLTGIPVQSIYHPPQADPA